VVRAAPAVRRARRRLLRLARKAARARQYGQLGQCERALSLLRRGLTAGEASEIAEWATLPEPAFLARLQRIPAGERPPALIGVDVVGVLAVEPGGACG
jgi:hypothetical protein